MARATKIPDIFEHTFKSSQATPFGGNVIVTRHIGKKGAITKIKSILSHNYNRIFNIKRDDLILFLWCF